MFATFDGPSGEACVARREVSNTPLQALTLLNDPVFIEAAQALGRTARRRRPGDEKAAIDLFRRCLDPAADGGRAVDCSCSSTRRSKSGFEREGARRGRDRRAGRGATSSSGPPGRSLARALFNLDEVVTKE